MSKNLAEIQHSVYCGRQKLGRYARTGKRRYEAFDPDDRPLGVFKTRERAQAVISKGREAAIAEA